MMPATRLATHRPNLKAGSVYSLTGFDVARCNPNYRLSDSSLLIRFSDSTYFKEVTDPAVPSPPESFRFRNHSEMLGLANTNNQLPDLIGDITDVKSTITDPPQGSMTMSLFDAQAVNIHNQLEKMRGDPRVVVATSVNPKMGGRIFLNATSGTHIYFDKETSAWESFFYSLVEQDIGVTPAAPLLRGYAKVEVLSIAELNNFVIIAPSQVCSQNYIFIFFIDRCLRLPEQSDFPTMSDIDFICNERVTDIKMDKGWCYVSFSSCAKKLQRTASSFTCVPFNNTYAVGVLLYRVEMSVADETGEGLFVCFDGVMTKLHNMRAYEAGHLLVRVSSYNFRENHQIFTISHIPREGGVTMTMEMTTTVATQTVPVKVEVARLMELLGR
ncbi:hypothetical protein DY000_02053302 [Brassica cretica]|uniref:Uncharacterized protein n=1 Tax=Brassica cretica TaxID=69181 RepID=A0ABQ7A4W8_BRACR|nr:hypothetical protein DY000_02053302 [Brassica cretica]